MSWTMTALVAVAVLPAVSLAVYTTVNLPSTPRSTVPTSTNPTACCPAPLFFFHDARIQQDVYLDAVRDIALDDVLCRRTSVGHNRAELGLEHNTEVAFHGDGGEGVLSFRITLRCVVMTFPL